MPRAAGVTPLLGRVWCTQPRLSLTQARARGLGYLTTPNLAAYGMQGLMWDAAQRMERKKPLYLPQPSDGMKVAKGINQEGRLLVDLSSHQRLGDHDKPPPGLPGSLNVPRARFWGT